MVRVDDHGKSLAASVKRRKKALMCRFRSRRKNACMHAGTEPGYPSISRLVMELLRINPPFSALHTFPSQIVISRWLVLVVFTTVSRPQKQNYSLEGRLPTPQKRTESSWIRLFPFQSPTPAPSRKIIFTPQSTPLPQAGDQTIGDLLNDVYIDLAERGWSRRLQLIRSLDLLGGGGHA